MKTYSSPDRLVNAWIFLNEDEPKVSGNPVGYNHPQSSFQRLIKNNIYSSVDLLFICFGDTERDGSTGYTTTVMGDGNHAIHPDGLTNNDYLKFVVRDSHATNPAIKCILTMGYNHGTLSRIFEFSGHTDQECAEAFAQNTVKFLREYQLDGLDFDWEGLVASELSAEQFNILMQSLRNAFDVAGSADGKYYYLTLCPASVGTMTAEGVNNYVDFITLQLYSGFTSEVEFTGIGIDKSKCAYGAKFESDYDTAENANQQAREGEYTVVTQWRLNSTNFYYQQSQQVELYSLFKNQ